MTAHKHYTREKIQQIYLLFGSAVLINFISLSIHNDLLPLIYIINVGLYYLLNCSISNSGTINFFSGLNKLFLSNRKPRQVLLSWAIIFFLPGFFALYSLDFGLSFITLVLNIVVAFFIRQINPQE